MADALRRARVTVDEIKAAVRASGLPTLADVESVILETDGSFSVIKQRQGEAAVVPIGVKQPCAHIHPKSTE